MMLILYAPFVSICISVRVPAVDLSSSSTCVMTVGAWRRFGFDVTAGYGDDSGLAIDGA